MANRPTLAPGEWYHCFSRGIDKRTTFETVADYERFIEMLYLANSTEPVHRGNIHYKKHDEVFSVPRSKPLVSVGAYALMPNHFHLLLYEIIDGGISNFMQKLGIAYAMYFNIKNNRTGNLFVKPFRSRHVDNDIYFQHCVDYIHLNPAELFESGWKRGVVKDLRALESNVVRYPYSSSKLFHVKQDAPESAVLGDEIRLIYEHKPMQTVLENARAYYEEHIKMVS